MSFSLNELLTNAAKLKTEKERRISEKFRQGLTAASVLAIRDAMRPVRFATWQHGNNDAIARG